MKITRILFAIISVMISTAASAQTDVNVLTRGGSNCGVQWCYFFEDDGSLKLTDAEGNTEYVEIKGSTMRMSDGREGFHRPFAEEDSEISLRPGRKYADLTWLAPNSANALADMLYKKSWICDFPGAAMTFYCADTCFVSDFRRLNLNQKFLWQALDAENINLTALSPPYNEKVYKIKMRPCGFDLIDNVAKRRYILNAYYKMDALGAVLDMCYFPLGCYSFFNGSEDEVKAYIRQTFSDDGGIDDFSVYIVGFLWTCDGVIITPDDRRVSYVNKPDKDAVVDKSFEYMALILNNLFTPAEDQQGDNTRIFIDESPGERGPLIITLAKHPCSGISDDGIGKSFVSLSIRKK